MEIKRDPSPAPPAPRLGEKEAWCISESLSSLPGFHCHLQRSENGDPTTCLCFMVRNYTHEGKEIGDRRLPHTKNGICELDIPHGPRQWKEISQFR